MFLIAKDVFNGQSLNRTVGNTFGWRTSIRVKKKDFVLVFVAGKRVAPL